MFPENFARHPCFVAAHQLTLPESVLISPLCASIEMAGLNAMWGMCWSNTAGDKSKSRNVYLEDQDKGGKLFR